MPSPCPFQNILNIVWKMIRLRCTIILEDSWNIENTGNYGVVVIQKIGWIITMWVYKVYMRALENIKKIGMKTIMWWYRRALQDSWACAVNKGSRSVHINEEQHDWTCIYGRTLIWCNFSTKN